MKRFYPAKFFVSLLILADTLIFSNVFAQQNVSISDVSATPDASSVLDVSSTSKGLLIPRIALTATNAASPITLPATSMLVYNTATAGLSPNNVTPGYYYNAGSPAVPNWLRIYAGSTAGAEWKLLGNAGTTAGTNFLGTTDAVDLVFKTNSTEQARINSIGNMGIGVAPLGTAGQARLSISRDATNACCGGENSTLALAEATTSTGRRPSISFHASGESEGVVHITQASTGIGVIGADRRLKFFDNQALGLGLELTGNLWYGNGNSRTQWRDNAGLQGDAGAQSGFYETYNPVNYPSGASSWWHLIDVRHSNAGNNFALQIAGSFFDQNLYYRKTNNSASTAWNQILTSNGNLAWLTTGNAGTVASTNFIGTTDAIDFVVRTTNTERMRVLSGGNVGVGTTAPVYKFQTDGDIYANGGWFRVSGNQGYYFESWGGGWQMVDATWIRAYNSKPILATGGLAGYGNAVFGSPFGGNPRIYANYDNVTGGGIAIADDGGFYDYNDGWITSRGSYGIKIKHNSTSSSDLLLLDMSNIAGTLQDRYLGTSNDNWGYVGISGRAWYRMYSYGFVTSSRRELKKDIYPVSGKTRELVLADLDKITPYFYRYKNETTDWNEGTETKYQANFHLGMLLDESPDYIQDNAFSGIDIYAAATLGIVAAKANMEDIKEIKKVIGMEQSTTKDISYFGQIELSVGEAFIPYEESFKNQLNGIKPIVTFSLDQEGVTVYIKEKRNDGLIVKINGETNQTVNLNFIMMAKVNIQSKDKTDETNNLSPEILNGMYVPEANKSKVRNFWEQNEIKRKEEEIRKANDAINVQQERKNQLGNGQFIKPEKN